MTLLAAVTAIGLQFVLLHGVEGRLIMINPTHVTTLVSAPPGAKNKLLVSGANCMLNMSDGKFITVAETCDQVAALFRAWRGNQ